MENLICLLQIKFAAVSLSITRLLLFRVLRHIKVILLREINSCQSVTENNSSKLDERLSLMARLISSFN